MTYFNRGGGDSRSQYYGPRSDSRGSRGGFGGGFGGNSERKELFDATCAKCGAACKVPFRPSGMKEVYCSKCFGEMNGGSDRSPRRFDNYSRGERREQSYLPPKINNNVDLSEINAKLDRIIKMLTPETPKDITAKILKEIEDNSGKEVVPEKKKAKKAKKVAVEK